jgi:hypothetical protein
MENTEFLLTAENMVYTTEMEGFRPTRLAQNPLQLPFTLNCVLYTNLGRTATNFYLRVNVDGDRRQLGA